MSHSKAHDNLSPSLMDLLADTEPSLENNNLYQDDMQICGRRKSRGMRYICTRVHGHLGEHIAHGDGDPPHIVARWSSQRISKSIPSPKETIRDLESRVRDLEERLAKWEAPVIEAQALGEDWTPQGDPV